MKILFVGTVKFSYDALKLLINLGENVIGVCTQKQSNHNSDFVDLADLSKSAGIPFKHVIDINSEEIINWIRLLAPDVIFCFGWSRILKKDILSTAPLGVVGFHPTCLPSNRGRHPIIWSLALGLSETCSTFFLMKEGVDDGDVLSQQRISINKNDDATSLYEKITKTALNQITNLIGDLKSGNLVKTPQNSASSNNWRKRNYDDGQIDWRMSARSIHNLVRALTNPYPGAFFISQNQKIIVWRSRILINKSVNLEPGKVIGIVKDGVVIKCGEDSIVLLETSPEFSGRKVVYL